MKSPHDILTSTLDRKGWDTARLVAELAAMGLTVTPATVRNWKAGRAVPMDEHRLPLVSLLGLDRDAFLTACCGGVQMGTRATPAAP